MYRLLRRLPGWAWGGYYAPYGWADTYVYEYDEGTLILDVLEPKSRQLIWRGSGTEEVWFSATPEQRQTALNEMARAILVNLPPPEKGSAQDPGPSHSKSDGEGGGG